MSRFYVKPEYVKNEEIIVPRQDAHHIIDVMRLGRGDDIVAFAGTGMEYCGTITSADKKGLIIKIKKINKTENSRRMHITLGQALPKRAQMDFIVEKATELGVDEIIPIVTERTIVRLDGARQEKKAGHWQNIARAAAEQCGRADIPKVRHPIKFESLLDETGDYDLGLMACLHPDTVHLKKHIPDFKGRRVLVLIGPEGDFTPEEIKSARASGLKLVSFGKSVLRMDTAAIFILSVLNYENHSI